MKFYVKAMGLSNNPEFRAKYCMMAAKCEQNEFFISKPKGYKGDFKAGDYFRFLKKNSTETIIIERLSESVVTSKHISIRLRSRSGVTKGQLYVVKIVHDKRCDLLRDSFW